MYGIGQKINPIMINIQGVYLDRSKLEISGALVYHLIILCFEAKKVLRIVFSLCFIFNRRGVYKKSPTFGVMNL